MSGFSGNERIASAKQCQLQWHYPRLEGFQEAAHTSRQAVPGHFQGRFGIQARRPPDHIGYRLLNRPGLIPVLTCLRFPKEIEHGGTGGHCHIPTVLSNILKEICPFMGTPPSPGGTESLLGSFLLPPLPTPLHTGASPALPFCAK